MQQQGTRRLALALGLGLGLGLGLATAGMNPAAQCADQPAPGIDRGDPQANLPGSEQDADFVRAASGLLPAEIEMSRLGIEKGEDPQVISLSREMAEAYATLSRELSDAAREQGLSTASEEDEHGENRVRPSGNHRSAI